MEVDSDSEPACYYAFYTVEEIEEYAIQQVCQLALNTMQNNYLLKKKSFLCDKRPLSLLHKNPLKGTILPYVMVFMVLLKYIGTYKCYIRTMYIHTSTLWLVNRKVHNPALHLLNQ